MEVGGIYLKSLAFSWLLVVALVITLALRQGPAFDSSILSLLPKSEQQPLVQQATDQMGANFSQRLLLLLSGKNEEKVRSSVSAIAETLSIQPDISSVYWQVEDDELSRIRQEQFPYRFSVIDAKIRNLLLSGDYQIIGNQALQRLFSPLPMGGNALIADPFGLHFELRKNRVLDLKIQVSNSLLKVNTVESPTYMMILTLEGDPFSAGLQKRVLNTIAAQQSLHSPTINNIDMSGLLIHAAAGAKQAKDEISTIGLGSLAGIVIAMLLAMRRLKPLLLMAFPIVIGCSFASAMVLLIFGRVHLVTFAFGAGLVGVSIDYALHYLCERRFSDSNQALRKIIAGLLLGLFSSVMAYAAQALTPFPGLRQMATFSVAGLFASWVTVVLWFPFLTRGDALGAIKFSDSLNGLRKRFPRIETSPLLIILLLVVLGLSLKSVWNSNSFDDIRLLQTSPASLLSQEQSIQRSLGISSSSRFLLIHADTIEQTLQKEEQLIPLLEKLKQRDLIGGYQALSLSLPSLKRQAENWDLVRELYAQQLPSFYTTTNVPQSGLTKALAILEQAKRLRLTPEIWQQQAISDSQKNLIVQQTDSSVATVIRLTGKLGSTAESELFNLSSSNDGVFYVDQIKNISSLMGKYRVQIINWVVLAYLFVFLALLFRYKQQVWRIVLPPLLASIFTLALLVQIEQGLNLFNLMALILVLGIGLDMGIFLIETDEAPHTWLAVSLSAYTSLLAFGLLALSNTPVLHHFGLTVAIGLCLVWFLVPLMRRN